MFNDDATRIIIDNVAPERDNPIGTEYGFYPTYPGQIVYVTGIEGYYQGTLTIINGSASLLIHYVGHNFYLFGWTASGEEIALSTFGDNQGEPQAVTIGSDSCRTRGQLYTSPEDSATGIQYFHFNTSGTEIDYMLIEVSEETDLRGQTILVDDSNPEILWHGGSWSEEVIVQTNNRWNDRPNCSSASKQKIYPHGNGTHHSRSGGDSFTFQFAGTSILVAGFDPRLPNSILTMNFTVDSNSTLLSFSPDKDLNQSSAGSPHFIYFSDDSLRPGNHTLIVNVEQIENTTATIDYLTYKPSFSNLLEKPNFSSGNLGKDRGTLGYDSNECISNNDNHRTVTALSVALGLVLLLDVLAGVYIYYRHRKERVTKNLAPTPYMLSEPVGENTLIQIINHEVEILKQEMSTIKDAVSPVPPAYYSDVRTSNIEWGPDSWCHSGSVPPYGSTTSERFSADSSCTLTRATNRSHLDTYSIKRKTPDFTT
ncbi:hypothetical protein K435DRAFT_879998 [Dendrothele bispora CBS 962.96]|uniref:Uncharacterized protein n=1 Tax=Dendrothele bispora (strain CBS 962.96) TaxID=1314807 RepID=A0A4S8KKE3_DENBC|nr:hypothetical protein K435DRAFT_879998 [Dendrothele bispora CBS 962.96]